MLSVGQEWMIEIREYTPLHYPNGSNQINRSPLWEEALDAPLNDGHIWPNTWDVLATRHKGKGNGFGVNGQGDPKEVSGLGNILMGDARVEPWTKQKFKKYGYQKGQSRLWKPYGKATQPSP